MCSPDWDLHFVGMSDRQTTQAENAIDLRAPTLMILNCRDCLFQTIQQVFFDESRLMAKQVIESPAAE